MAVDTDNNNLNLSIWRQFLGAIAAVYDGKLSAVAVTRGKTFLRISSVFRVSLFVILTCFGVDILAKGLTLIGFALCLSTVLIFSIYHFIDAAHENSNRAQFSVTKVTIPEKVKRANAASPKLSERVLKYMNVGLGGLAGLNACILLSHFFAPGVMQWLGMSSTVYLSISIALTIAFLVLTFRIYLRYEDKVSAVHRLQINALEWLKSDQDDQSDAKQLQDMINTLVANLDRSSEPSFLTQRNADGKSVKRESQAVAQGAPASVTPGASSESKDHRPSFNAESFKFAVQKKQRSFDAPRLGLNPKIPIYEEEGDGGRGQWVFKYGKKGTRDRIWRTHHAQLIIALAIVVVFAFVWLIPFAWVQGLVPFFSEMTARLLASVFIAFVAGLLLYFDRKPNEPKAAGCLIGLPHFLLGIGSFFSLSLVPGKLNLVSILPPLHEVFASPIFIACYISVAIIFSCIYAVLEGKVECESDGAEVWATAASQVLRGECAVAANDFVNKTLSPADAAGPVTPEKGRAGLSLS